MLLHLIDGIFLKTTINWADERNELNSMLHIIKIGNMIFDVIIIISIQSLVYISIFELLVFVLNVLSIDIWKKNQYPSNIFLLKAKT